MGYTLSKAVVERSYQIVTDDAGIGSLIAGLTEIQNKNVNGPTAIVETLASAGQGTWNVTVLKPDAP